MTDDANTPAPSHSSTSASKAEQMDAVIGPNGEPLTLQSLPSPNTKRWVIRRKAEVVAAVKGGLLSLDAACKRYHLSHEEFKLWEAAIKENGVPGLRVTRLKDYRAPETDAP